MEEHQHNEPFKEEYWQDALGVLEQEERKARRRKVVPLFFSIAALVLVVFAVRYYVTPTTLERAATDTLEGPHTNRVVENSAKATEAEADRLTDTPDNTPVPTNSLYTDNQEVERASMDKQPNENHHPVETENNQDGLIADENSFEKEGENAELNPNENGSATGLENGQEDSAHEQSGHDEPVDELLDGAEDENTKGGNPYESILNQGQPSLPSTNTSPSGFGFANAAISPRSPSRIATGEGKLFSMHFEDKHREFLRLPTMSTPITLFVGNAFAPGYGSRKASHWNPQAGIALEHRVENNLWFRVSVGGQQISQTFAAKSYLEEQASFGYEALETRISTDRLYLLDVPVGLVWDAFMRHSFIVGGGVEAIVRTENTLEKNKIDAFGTQNIDSESSYGYLTGYKPIMYNLNFGYRYKFSKRNSLDIVASTGFHEVNQIGTSKNGRISVRYNFQIK